MNGHADDQPVVVGPEILTDERVLAGGNAVEQAGGLSVEDRKVVFVWRVRPGNQCGDVLSVRRNADVGEVRRSNEIVDGRWPGGWSSRGLFIRRRCNKGQ